jgi:poly-gamma-glutamate capsule biosynthesis protein CapA/YwtB (metallophosphatase superfamily)
MRRAYLVAFVMSLTVALVASFFLFRKTRQIDYAAADPENIETATPLTQNDTIKLLFVGDVMLSRQVGDKIVASGDWKYPFLRIKDFLSDADLTIANLETTVSDRGTRVGSIYSFRSDPRTMEGLVYAGIDIVSLANNHIWDYSMEAFLDTMKYLTENAIEYVGAGHGYTEAHQGITKTIKGTRITFLGYTDLLSKSLAATATRPGIAVYNKEEMINDIAAAKAKSDLVIINFHTGTEYETKHSAHQEQIYTTAIDAGADLVVGHHPHVAQEVEPYKDGWIAYSLGNFIFDQYFSEETMKGLALRVTVKNKGISNVESIVVNISPQSQAYLQ